MLFRKTKTRRARALRGAKSAGPPRDHRVGPRSRAVTNAALAASPETTCDSITSQTSPVAAATKKLEEPRVLRESAEGSLFPRATHEMDGQPGRAPSPCGPLRVRAEPAQPDAEPVPADERLDHHAHRRDGRAHRRPESRWRSRAAGGGRRQQRPRRRARRPPSDDVSRRRARVRRNEPSGAKGVRERSLVLERRGACETGSRDSDACKLFH